MQKLSCFYLREIVINQQLLNRAMTTLSLRSAKRRPLQCEFVSDLRGVMFRCVVFILYWPCSHQTDVHSALGVFKRHADSQNTVLNSPKLIQGVNSKASSASVVQITSMGQVSWHYDFRSDNVSNRSMYTVNCADMLCVNSTER